MQFVIIYTSQSEVQKNQWDLQNRQLAVLLELIMTSLSFLQHFYKLNGLTGNNLQYYEKVIQTAWHQ